MNRSSRGVQQVNGSVSLSGPQAVNPTAALRNLVALLTSVTDSSTGDPRLRVATVNESYNFTAWGRQQCASPVSQKIFSPWG